MRILKLTFIILSTTVMLLTGCCKPKQRFEDKNVTLPYDNAARYTMMQRPSGSYWVYKDFEHNTIDTLFDYIFVNKTNAEMFRDNCNNFFVKSYELSKVRIKNSTNTVNFIIQLLNTGFEFTDNNVFKVTSTGYKYATYTKAEYCCLKSNEIAGKVFENSVLYNFSEKGYKSYFKTIVMQPPLGIVAFQDSSNNLFELTTHHLIP